MARTLLEQHESPLGRWTRALRYPDAPLAAHVEMLWFVSGHATYERDRRLPNGCTHLIFNLASPCKLFSQTNAAPRTFATCWLSGQQNGYIETGSIGRTILVGAQLRSHAAYRLFAIPQYELCDTVVELEALLGDRVLAVRQRLLAAQSVEDSIDLLEHWLLDMLKRSNRPRPLVSAMNNAIAIDPGNLRLELLSKDFGFSREYLIRQFREQIGLTPKAYANILRFNKALKSARNGRISWAEIATDCGYYDQAHLARDFQRYAGRAPTSLLLDRRPDADSIVLS